jgi:hypothetical protein
MTTMTLAAMRRIKFGLIILTEEVLSVAVRSI